MCNCGWMILVLCKVKYVSVRKIKKKVLAFFNTKVSEFFSYFFTEHLGTVLPVLRDHLSLKTRYCLENVQMFFTCFNIN